MVLLGLVASVACQALKGFFDLSLHVVHVAVLVYVLNSVIFRS